jgi:hypothetical protein
MIKAPRREKYTFGGLAEYWRHEYGVRVFESDVKNYVDSGELKASVRYEPYNVPGWWKGERPKIECRFNVMHFRPLDEPPTKTYIRLADAIEFEQQHFMEQADPQPVTAKKYNFEGSDKKPIKPVAPLTQVIEAFYAAPYQPHDKTNFYKYVKVQCANNQAQINGVLFSKLVEKVVTAERGKGIYMVEPKERAKSGTEQDYKYTDSAISTALSRAKKKPQT